MIFQVGHECYHKYYDKREHREICHTPTEQKVMWRWRQRFEWCGHKPRYVGNRQKECILPSGFQKVQPCQHIDLTQRYWSGPSGVQDCKKINFYCAKPPSLQYLWQQSKETNIILQPLLPGLHALTINMRSRTRIKKTKPMMMKMTKREKSKPGILPTSLLASA